MTITIPISELSQLLGLDTDQDVVEQIKSTYSDVDVSIVDDDAVIEIDDIFSLDEQVYQHLIKLCDQGRFDKALTKALGLYEDFKLSSELNRIIGQIYFMQSSLSKSEDYLIEALRLNPKNHHALLLMGNLQHTKQDLDAALTYWHSALRYNADDFIALSNIGSSLAKANKFEEAQAFFEQSLAVNPKFDNAHLGLGMLAYHTDDYPKAFEYATKTLKLSDYRSEVYHNALNLGMSVAKAITKTKVSILEDEVKVLQHQLEQASGKPIEVQLVDDLSQPAKIIIAEYHQKEKHQLLYKSEDLLVPHLMLHELYHLQLICDARSVEQNYIFTSDQENEKQFWKRYDKYKQSMIKKGLPEAQVDQLINSLFQGLNSQAYNTPIDLFIEDLIYKNHPDARVVQFLSLYNLNKTGIEATTNSDIVSSLPKSIISKSKILNLVNALHYKDLYGVDMVSEFKASKVELSEAKAFFEEFQDYRDDKAPAEEYEILEHWAEDLNIHSYFDFVLERQSADKTADEVLDEVNDDPFGLNSPEPEEQVKARTKFIETHSTEDTNKAVTFHMMSALEFFRGKSKDEVKSIAMEFATLGMTGIDPKKKNYEVPSVPKVMTGYQTLAYYYVSWAIAMPEMLGQLGMPFEKEFLLAKRMVSGA